MRRLIYYSFFILLSTCTTIVFASGFDYVKEDSTGYSVEPSFEVIDESDYSRNGHAVYLFGDFLYTNRFLNDKTQTVTNPNASVSYKPTGVTPNHFQGIEVGFGKELSHHLDAQLAYLQHLSRTKNGTINSSASSITVKMNGVSTDLGYTFNPDDQFQVMGKFGLLVSDFHQTVTIGNTAYYPTNNSIKIDPMAGLEFIFQLSHKFAFRLSSTYALSTYGTTSTGQVDAMGGFSYVL